MKNENPFHQVLRQAGLILDTGEVAGADASHPDAALLDLMRRYSLESHHARALLHQVEALGEDHRDYPRTFEEFRSHQFAADDLEKAIADTPARTREAASAKMMLALATVDPEGEGCFASLFQLCASALRDGLAVGC